MNRKGFAISIILYSIVILLISIFYMLLGIMRNRYVVSSSLRESIIEQLNESNTLYDKIMKLCDDSSIKYVKKYDTSQGIPTDTLDGDGGGISCYFTSTNNSYKNDLASKNGNIIFGGYCWQIVRTSTDKGVKLVYNGIPTADNKCPYTSREKASGPIGKSATTKELSGSKLYGKDFTYSGTQFTLVDTFTSNWSSDYSSIIGNFTCGNTSSSCTTLYYVGNYKSSTSAGVIPYTVGSVLHPFIGSTPFNSFNSPAASGYMYNDIFMVDSNSYGAMNNFLDYTTLANSTELYVGDKAIWNPSTRMYDLKEDDGTGNYVTPTSLKRWGDIYNNIKGKYICVFSNTTSCSQVKYILDNKSTMYYMNLSNGDTENKTITLTYATSYSKNGNNYVLQDPVTTVIPLKDWYTDYEQYENVYMCNDFASSTCNELYYIYDTNNIYIYYNKSSKNYIYGNSVTYSGGKYTIDSSANTSNYQSMWDFAKNNSNLKTTHYTCFKTSTNECDGEVYFIFSTTKTAAYYIKLTNGEKAEDAFKKMLNTNNSSSSTLNKYSSPVKKLVENWYKKNIEDNGLSRFIDYNAVYCNDRSVINDSGWNPNGSIGSIKFTKQSDTEDYSCTNITDKFSVNNSVAKLDYPVGLRTQAEYHAMGSGYNSYRIGDCTTSDWTSTPTYINSSGVSMIACPICTTLQQSTSTVNYLRPVITLKPGIEATGKGTYDEPYIVNTDNE